ncbi:MAG TPA: HTTM domain-containing protein [Thermoanaerobaculia bacterium]
MSGVPDPESHPPSRRLSLARAIGAPLAIVASFLAFVYAARPIARRAVQAVYERRTPFPWLHSLVRHGEANTLEAYESRGDLWVVRFALLLLLGGSIVWAVRHADRVRATLRAFFGETGSAIDLAVFRILLFGTIFYCADPSTIRLYSGLPRELLTPPLGFGLTVRMLPFEPRTAVAAALLLRGVCLLGIVGLFTRSAAFAIALLTYYVLGIPQCFGQVDHYHFLAWFSLLLAFSRCGDALSIDSLVLRGVVPDSESVLYARPIRWVWVLMGIVYLFPGLWKLWISGDRWFFGHALASHMYVKWAELRWIPAIRLDRVPGLARAAGLAAIAFELTFLPLVFHRRTRAFAAVAGLAFHNLSSALMGISFFWLQLMYASFVPWSRWFAPLFRARPAQGGADASPRARRTLDLVGSLLVAANTIMGALMIEEGWPIACFPTFARTARTQTLEMRFSAVSASGDEKPIDAWPLIQRLGTERWVPLTRHSVRSPAMVSALARWVADHSPEAGNAARVMVYCVRWSPHPEVRRKGPNSTELLAVVPR